MRVVYLPAKKRAYEELRGYLQEGQVFDKLAVALSGMFRFPREVTVVWNECGTVNAYWDGQGHIVMCYELVDFITGLFAKRLQGQKLRAAVMSTVMFSFLHEFGHALIAVYQLPAVGREEDAADQLAALMLIRVGGESGVTVAMHGAQFFRLAALSGGKPHFFDEHSLDAQRFYNVLCMVYGSNPQQLGSMVGDDRLPASRAQRCPNEYGKIANAWASLLRPHMR